MQTLLRRTKSPNPPTFLDLFVHDDEGSYIKTNELSVSPYRHQGLSRQVQGLVPIVSQRETGEGFVGPAAIFRLGRNWFAMKPWVWTTSGYRFAF